MQSIKQATTPLSQQKEKRLWSLNHQNKTSKKRRILRLRRIFFFETSQNATFFAYFKVGVSLVCRFLISSYSYCAAQSCCGVCLACTCELHCWYDQSATPDVFHLTLSLSISLSLSLCLSLSHSLSLSLSLSPTEISDQCEAFWDLEFLSFWILEFLSSCVLVFLCSCVLEF